MPRQRGRRRWYRWPQQAHFASSASTVNRPLKRLLIACGLSVATHGLIVLAGFWSFDFGLGLDPDLGLEFTDIQLVDIDAEQAEQPALAPLEPPPVVLPPPAAELPPDNDGETDKQPPEEDAKKPEPKFGEKKSSIDKLAPTNATFSMMLANKRIRRLPFAREAADIMAPLPDFEFIIGDGGFDTWRDFNYIVIASPNVRVVSQTFLAVQYKLSTREIKAGLERAAALRGLGLTWEVRGGMEMANPRPLDPNLEDQDVRWFVLLEDEKVAMYVREEYLPQIIAGPDGSKKTASNFVANVSRMRRFTNKEPSAGLQLKFKDIRSMVKRARNLPFELPDDLEIMAEATKNPQIMVRLGFLEPTHAAAFADYWHTELREIIRKPHIRFMIGSDYSNTEVAVQGKQVVLRNRLSEARTQFVLGLLAQQTRQMMKRSAEEMDKKRSARDALQVLRRAKNLSPSEALAVQQTLLDEATPQASAGEQRGAPAPAPANGTDTDGPDRGTS